MEDNDEEEQEGDEEVEDDDEEQEEGDEEVNDEDEEAEVVLARCIENARATSSNRRSSRHSTYRGANLSRALEEQTYEEICNLD